MIASLRGELIHKAPDRLIIDVNGVGYTLSFCQAGASLVPECGDQIFIYTYLHVREDSLELFGFMRPEEKEMFITLLQVSGIGPRVGLNILSAISPTELARALCSEDLHRLTKLPGIGKKTAERLCLELKDKVLALAGQEASYEPPGTSNDEAISEDVVSALVNLGYPQARAVQALRTVRQSLKQDEPEPPIEELLRRTLRSLA